jgi:hypothetical protein
MAGDLATYVKAFSDLNPQIDREYWPADTLGQAPYKPLLLLIVTDNIASGTISDNDIRLTSGLRERLFVVLWTKPAAA